MARLMSVYPISGEDPNALPVKDLEAAITFYKERLGFSLDSRDSSKAVVTRDNIRVGVVMEVGHEPGKAGSLAFAVDQIEAMHAELQASGANPGAFGIDEWNGKQHRTFFVREDHNGYCYCFYAPVSAEPYKP